MSAAVFCRDTHLFASPAAHAASPTRGALTIAFKNPDAYAAVSAFAPICNPSAVPWGEKAFGAYLGDAAAGEDLRRFQSFSLAPPFMHSSYEREEAPL